MEDKSGFPEQMPQTIGRYKVQEGIGYGAMGAVYKAFDPLIKRTLAIKTIRLDIPRQSPQYKTFIDRFYHEARISGTLSHPNIVTLFDIGEEGGVPYLAMEFVEGETISAQIEKGTRFKPEKVIALVSQIASAVDYAHTKGVIHRDIKPSNLILYEGDRIKVTDFGIAKLVDSEMTQSGTLLGTPSYMSPEQAMGEKLDGRSDIFSLGVCAFEMLSGEQPFPGANVTSILYKLVHVDPIEPANLEMNGLVPQKWHEVFSKVLAKKPDDRYQTATAFVQDLEYCLGAWFGSAMGDEGGQTIVGVTEAEIAEGTTKAIPRIEVDKASAPAPAAPADDRPATILMKAEPSPPPPSKKQKEKPAPILKKPTEPAPPPAPQKQEEKPATILMKPTEAPSAAPEEDDKASTIITKAAPEATILMKGGSSKEAKPTPKEPDAPATILMSSQPKAPVREEETVQQPIPEKVLKAPAPPPRPPSPPRKAATPPTGEEAAPPKKSALPTGLLIGGVALVVLALGVIGIVVLLRRVLPGRAPSPTTLPPASFVLETPAPPPTTSAPAPLATGVIHVESEPAGASVLLNGTPKGVAPMDLGALPFATYEVRLELKGYEPRSTSIVLSEEKPRGEAKVTLPKVAAAMAVTDVVSTPFGAASARPSGRRR